MPAPTIIRGSDQMFSTIYEGNGGGQRVGKFVPFTDNGTIAKSCIFEDGDEPELSRTPSGAGNRDTFTLSFWIKRSNIGTLQLIYQQGADVNNCTQFSFDSNDRLQYQQVDGGGNTDSLISNRTFEDTSKFYHIVLAVDTTQSTEANRVRMYVDGDEITSWSTANYPSQNTDTDMNTTTEFSIGRQLGATSAYSPDCYLAEVNYVDGTQYTPSTFGLTDTSTGRWIPKSLTGISYGTNGFRLEFANSAGQTIGDDTSGNGNDFTVSNIATTDLTTDSPTQNHATLSPLRTAGSLSLSEGNLKITGTGGSAYGKAATEKEFPSDTSTGLYWEYTDCANGFEGGVIKATKGKPQSTAGETEGIIIQRRGGGGGNTYWVQKDDDSSIYNDTGVSASDGQTIGVAVKSGKIWFAINNTWVLSGDPAAGTNPAGELDPTDYFAMLSVYGTVNMTANFGQKSFQYTPPTGFVAYQQDNFPETGKGIPDFVWIKNRDATDSHQLYDSSRGPLLDIHSDSSVSESTTTDGLQKFLKGGCQIEDDVSVNTSGESYVAWNWVANGGTTSANTDGSGATIASTIQANQTAGFSIVQWTGNNTSNSKIAHGLSQAPEWILVKNLTDNTDWWVYHKNLTADKNVKLNTSDAEGTFGTGVFDHSGVTNQVFEVDNGSSNGNSINGNTDSMIAYCWHSIEGFSKFDTYTGNGNSNGTFVHTGFKPSFLMIKCITHANNWVMYNNKMNLFNPVGETLGTLFPNRTNAAETQGGIDFLANGFKCRSTYENFNGSSRTYIYMAFAEHPFIGDGTNPVTAR